MRSPSSPLQGIAAALALAGCAGGQGAAVPSDAIPPPPASSAVRAPGGLPGIAEITSLPTIPVQIASDLAGNEWIAGFGPSMLVRVNEQSHASTRYLLPIENSDPFAVALGPQRTSMWFTELATNTVGYIALGNGAIHRYTIPTAHAMPYSIAAGPDNAMWFTELGSGKIGRINVSNHAISEYSLPAGHEPFQITLGPDNALWFTDYAGYGIGRMTTDHRFTAFGFRDKYFLAGITAASDGGIWFVGSSPDVAEVVGRIDPTTHVKKIWAYDKGGDRAPQMVTSRDSDLWFTERDDATIARFDISTHTLKRYALPSGYTLPLGIALGADRQLWFTEQDTTPHGPAVGKLCPDLTSSLCATSP